MNLADQRLSDHLAQFVSDHKKAFVDKVINERTRHITVVLEDIFQSQNASAVVRTCECLGLQDIHIVENTAKYQLNVRVLKGANKWINLERYRTRGVNNTETCFQKLRDEGYRIFVADPAEDGKPVDSIDVTEKKVALVFGNELRGASQYALQQCDERVHIPMYGFTESFNISVSVAICLNTLLSKLRTSGSSFKLSDPEKEVLRLNWYKKMVRRSDLLEREFLKTIQ